jgi:hypothetical protein
MIAATAIANDLPVYTCNPKDFEGIDRLDVIVVPMPGPTSREILGRPPCFGLRPASFKRQGRRLGTAIA